MFDIDKWTEIYLSLKKHKLRTALTAFGVFWGIFMLVVLLGFGDGFQSGVYKSFDVAKNAVFLWSQRTSIPYAGLKVGRFIQLTQEDAYAIRREIAEVDVISPRTRMGDGVAARGTQQSAFNVFGDTPELLKVEPVWVDKGRFINEKDLADRRKVAIIGEQVQKLLFKADENPLGQYIKIKGVFFQVVGIFKSRQKGEDAIESTKTIYIPITTFQYTFNQINKVHWFAFVPKEGIESRIIEEKIKKLLAQRHKVSPDDLKAFGSANVEEEFKKIQGLFTGIRGFSWLVSIGTILAGIVGVGNIMLIIVKERTKEIGIRKALGATPFSIVSLILQESITITFLSGFLGLFGGTALIELINVLLKKFDAEGKFFADPKIDFTVAITAFVVLVISGTLAGLIPASKAASVNPVEALAVE